MRTSVFLFFLFLISCANDASVYYTGEVCDAPKQWGERLLDHAFQGTSLPALASFPHYSQTSPAVGDLSEAGHATLDFQVTAVCGPIQVHGFLVALYPESPTEPWMESWDREENPMFGNLAFGPGLELAEVLPNSPVVRNSTDNSVVDRHYSWDWREEATPGNGARFPSPFRFSEGETLSLSFNMLPEAIPEGESYTITLKSLWWTDAARDLDELVRDDMPFPPTGEEMPNAHGGTTYLPY